MTAQDTATTPASRTIRAGEVEVHYEEVGTGVPLVLLQGAMASSSALWAGTPFGWWSQMTTLAEHFHVLAPDTRGAGRTVDPGGSASFAQLADDVAAFVSALELERPILCGFSEGGMTATVAAIRHPQLFRAVVNYAGYDLLDPHAPSFQMARTVFGGHPEATAADPAAIEANFGRDEGMRRLLAIMQEDLDGPKGPGAWQAYFDRFFERATHSPGYTVEDLPSIDCPALVLVGDRDDFCPVEDGVQAFRRLPQGELAVVPGTGHGITAEVVRVLREYCRRVA